MKKDYAIYLLKRLCYGSSVDAMPIIPQYEFSQALSVAIKALEQTRWIPCAERLPEQSGWYLVSLKNMSVQKAWYRAAPINQGGSYWRGSIKRPIAWMPLPEPYKAESEGEA